MLIWNTRGTFGLATVPQQLPQSQMPFHTYANYVMGPPQVSLSFRVEPPTDWSIYVGVCCGICFLFTGPFPTIGTQLSGIATVPPFIAYLWQAYVHPGYSPRPMPTMH